VLFPETRNLTPDSLSPRRCIKWVPSGCPVTFVRFAFLPYTATEGGEFALKKVNQASKKILIMMPRSTNVGFTQLVTAL